jgi:hypothetical protein
MRDAKKPLKTDSPDLQKAIGLIDQSIRAFETRNTEEGKIDAIRARVVLAEVHNILGATDKVLALVLPLSAALEKNELPGNLPEGMDTQILGLVLRVYVAKRDVDKAMKVLESLRKRSDEAGGLGGGLTALLRDLGQQLKDQIALLEQQDDGALEQLDQTKENFRVFLNQLEQTPSLPNDLRMWVGTSYLGLEDYESAVGVFAGFKEPVAGEPQQIYRQSQLLRVRALRLAAKEQKNARLRKEAFAKADGTLKEIMVKEWARRNPAFLSEEIMLLQDQELYSGPGGAIARWDQLSKGLERLIGNNPSFRSLYNDANYHKVYCMYMEAKGLKDKALQDEALKKIARTLNPLKRNDYGGPEAKARFEAFLNDPAHRDLRIAFEALQKEGT